MNGRYVVRSQLVVIALLVAPSLSTALVAIGIASADSASVKHLTGAEIRAKLPAHTFRQDGRRWPLERLVALQGDLGYQR
jgi:hypothetical protein